MQIEIFELLELTIETSEGPVNRNAFEKWVDDNDKRPMVDEYRNILCGWDYYYYWSSYAEMDIAEYLQWLHNPRKTNVSLTLK